MADHVAAVREAQARLRPHVRRTPLLVTDVGTVKPECLQLTGSFKARGAFNAVLQRRQARRGTGSEVVGVAAVSSGNHGQAVARAARTLGLAAVVVMPHDSAAVKVEAVRRLGARVVSDGVTAENREARFEAIVAETGYEAIHPFDDWDVIHGQGTVALEAVEDHPELTQIVVPVGGGGLLSGTALAVRAGRAPVRVVGVEPERAADAVESFRTGRLVSRPPGVTLADGARPAALGARPFEVVVKRRLVDEVVCVGEESIAAATVRLWREARLFVEPTGALALAAVMSGIVGADTGTVLVVSGGNFDPGRVGELLALDRRAL